jgi:hypothetical protein
MTTPNALTYNGFISAIAVLAVTQTTVNSVDSTGTLHFVEPNLDSIVPQMLNYAELRIQRDLDLLSLQAPKTAPYVLTFGNNTLQIPSSDILIVQNMQVADGTKITPMTPVSKEWIQAIYDDSTITGAPRYFAPLGGDDASDGLTSLLFMIGPYPDKAYSITVTGMKRAASLFRFGGTPQTNTGVTFISTYLPDLLLMASMIFVSAHQRNFSSAGSDPQMPVNYEQQYQTLLKTASIEEMRKRFHSIGGSSETPSLATASTK